MKIGILQEMGVLGILGDDGQLWYVLIVIAVMTVLLVWERWLVQEAVLIGAILCLVLGGIITTKEALAGFANSATIAVALMFLLAHALEKTGFLYILLRRALPERADRLSLVILRYTVLVMLISAVAPNTAVVAVLLPVTVSWCERKGISPSLLLLPLSYAAILGGMCTLIGTSTNLVAQGILTQRQAEPMGFFEIGLFGIPVALAGIVAMAVWFPRVLPAHAATDLQHTEDFVVQVKVTEQFAGVGKSIERAGLRNLQGLFLFQIERARIPNQHSEQGGHIEQSEIIASPSPDTVIQAGDRLFFTGITATILELKMRQGLEIMQESGVDLHQYDSSAYQTFEAVVGTGSPLLGQTVRDSDFRAQHDAVILAIRRKGERIQQKIGDVVFAAGDLLLLLARRDFAKGWRRSDHFALVSAASEAPALPRKAGIQVLLLFLGVVIAAALGVDLVLASSICLFFLLALRLLAPQDIWGAVNVKILLLLNCSLALGQAVESSGLAHTLAGFLQNVGTAYGPVFLALAVYIATVIYTEIAANTAAVAVFLPIALALAEQGGYAVRPLILVVTIAASCSFVLPIGYQTHILVQGAGGYKGKDFLRAGAILHAVALVVVACAAYLWLG